MCLDNEKPRVERSTRGLVSPAGHAYTLGDHKEQRKNFRLLACKENNTMHNAPDGTGALNWGLQLVRLWNHTDGACVFQRVSVCLVAWFHHEVSTTFGERPARCDGAGGCVAFECLLG